MLMLPESDTALKDPSYSCVQEHVMGKKVTFFAKLVHTAICW